MLAGLLVSSVGVLAAPSTSHAQSRDPAQSASGLPAFHSGESLVSAVRDAFTDMERVMRPCVAGRTGRAQIDVRFIGIPTGDPRISDGLRDEINARFVATINQISPYVANPYEVNKLLPKLTPGTTVGGQQLVAAINEQVDSPIVAIVEPSRPTVDVLTLKFQLLGRGESGVFGCPQERLMHLALPGLTLTERPDKDLDLRTFDGFADASLSHLTPGLLDLKALSAVFGPRPGLESEPLCPDLHKLMTRLRARYYGFRRSEAISALGTQRLPGLSVGNYVMAPSTGEDALQEGAASTKVILHLTPEDSSGIYFAGLVLSDGSVEVDASYSRIALEAPVASECFTAPTTVANVGTESEPVANGTTESATPANGSSDADSSSNPQDMGVAGDCIAFARTGSVAREECLKPGDIFRDCDACPEMVVIPAGEVRIGATPNEPGHKDVEGPPTDVTIGQPFAIGRFEVTRDEFAIFVANTGHATGDHCYVWSAKGQWQKARGLNYENPGFGQIGDHPAVCISHADARAYLTWLNDGLGLDPAAEGYRLPSEAEWEYAARAGEDGTGWSDEAGLARIAQFRKSGSPVQLPGTTSTGSRAPNGFGLYDMLGNAWEWGADCWIDSLDTMPVNGSARTKDCTYATHYILRGGSWNDTAEYNRFAKRSYTLGTAYSQDVGFRVVRPLFLRVPSITAEAPAQKAPDATPATSTGETATTNAN